MSDIVISFTTTNTEKEAKRLAYQIVEEKLAACVNLVSKVRSFYEWDGEIHDETEYMLIIKSHRSKLDKLKGFVERMHTYEVPEFISIDVSDGLPDYLQWVRDATLD